MTDEQTFTRKSKRPKTDEAAPAVTETTVPPVEAVVENPTSAPTAGVAIAETSTTVEGDPTEPSLTIPPVEGWDNVIFNAPKDGTRVMVSKDGTGNGVLVYWRISKFVDKKNLKYVPRGRWTDFLTKVDIDFEPQYWKAYDPEQYWPLCKGKA